ncbi:MAG: ubiquinol-cytochrome c reductase cytochrome b subunit [Actinomycetota bacterium]|nr:ubiquinol-cytochrome c reductase cytochrome b subunit [Actinomycetota bacterium]
MTATEHGPRPTNATTTPGARPAAKPAPKVVKKALDEIDQRFGTAGFLKRNLNKVFPDHWSFMLGEIALYSFIVLLLSGTFLTFFFRPGTNEIPYTGSYLPLRGLKMTEAFASTLRISFDVRGGLLIRQIHHWAALVFMAAIVAHCCRIFFTGAFRKPRETNWLIGVGLITLGILEGFAGYSLPDDLLSGTGLRIAYGIVEAIPLVGTYLGSFAFGGQFPGPDFIPRLFTIHILLVPGILLALITVHLLLMWHQKHTQWPAEHRTNENVVGAPFYPAFMAKTGGFFFAVFAVIAGLSAFVQINPVWLYGPYNPMQVGAGSQPDFYVGWLEGALRMMPNWETNIAHHYTISWNVLIPAVVIPGILFTAMALYPFLEAWVTRDYRAHNICDRPRNRPGRTALGVAVLAALAVLLLAGGNDVLAEKYSISLYATTWISRVAFFVLPAIAFFATRRICLGLQRRDLHSAQHGYETGRIVMLANGEFIEVEAALPEELVARMGLEYRQPAPPALPPAVDESGVRSPRSRNPLERVRSAIGGFLYEPGVGPTTNGHADGHAADGHADGGHAAEHEPPELTPGSSDSPHS